MACFMIAVLLLLCDAFAEKAPSCAGICTSGRELKRLTERTGYVIHQTWAADKTDLLEWMAHQVMENIMQQKKMKLSLKALSTFLEKEGMTSRRSGPKLDAKHATKLLLDLRRSTLERRGATDSEKDDEVFDDILNSMPPESVSNCFQGVLVPSRFKFDSAAAHGERVTTDLSQDGESNEDDRKEPNTDDGAPDAHYAGSDDGQEGIAARGTEDRYSRSDESEGSVNLDALKSEAAAEVDRILSSQEPILGVGPLRERWHEYHRIMLLLHPDKGLVSGDRADRAMRLLLGARPKRRLSSSAA